MKFTHLHVHSNYSFCRGANTIEQICAAARTKGFTPLALTDTNGLYGLGWFLQTARKYDLQPIIGAFLTTADTHCVVLVKNYIGYKFLCRAISKIHCQAEFNLKDYLVHHKQDVFILSNDTALLLALKQQNQLEDVFAELVPHEKPQSLLNFARQHDIPVVATNQVYCVSRQDFATHRMLRAIDLNTTLERVPSSELASPNGNLATAEEMAAMLPNAPEAVENSTKIARNCLTNLDFKHPIFPAYKSPNGQDVDAYLLEKVHEGILWRYGEMNADIQKRLDYEMEIILEKKFAPYFLVVAEIVKKAPRTCGRGSAAASLVSYALGITHVDPLKYNLFFERFLNKGRQDPPDIDVDFPWDERDEILNYIFETYRPENVAMIANHNSFKVRSAVREIAKVYGLPDAEIGAITKKMTGSWQPSDIWDLTQSHPIYKATEFPEPWPEIISLAEKIRGYPRHLSLHCGGVVIAPDGLQNYVPIQPAQKVLKLTGILDPESTGIPNATEPHELRVVQWEKDQSEDMYLVKMDILGNRSLAVIRDALAAVKANYDIDINYSTWHPLHDFKTNELIRNGDTIGVFYVESPAMRLLQKKTQKGDFRHLVIHSSIIRPAANVYINEYIRRLKGGKWQSLHPLLDNLLQETFGIMVYQEDVSKVVMALADFTPAEADDLRKIISKKHKERQIQDYKEQFYFGAGSKGVSQKTCDDIWNMILSFSGYSFCKPHSASYALVSFKSAYLRAHYPAEFIAAVISNQGGYYSTFAYISEARRMGLTILLPDINLSEQHYKGRKHKVRVGFMQLKGINKQVIKRLLNERESGQFTSLTDFQNRVECDPSDMAILIKSGCFDTIEPNKTRPQLLWQARLAPIGINYSKNDTLSLFDQERPQCIPAPPEYDEHTIWQLEMDTLGFLLSRHPLTLYGDRLNEQNIVKAKDLKRYIKQRVKTVGWYIAGKITSTKNQDLMEFISFEDTTAIYETTFFPKTFAKFVHMLSRTRPFILESIVESHYGAITLSVEKVEYL